MIRDFISNNKIILTEETEGLFQYAQAYLDGATLLCQDMLLKNKSCWSWPNASVILLLSAHAIELFLKGAILCRNPSSRPTTHDLNDLGDQYKRLFPEPSFEWDIPFRVNFPEGMTETEIQELRNKHKDLVRPNSVYYRYPVGKNGKPWSISDLFEPQPFLNTIEQIKLDFTRIKAQIN